MNEGHAALCTSPEWAEFLQTNVLEPLVSAVDIGGNMVEFGPGPGAATRWLHTRVQRLTVVELEPAAADRLSKEFAETNVTVVVGDCAATELRSGGYDSVAAFTMLHHVPTQQGQFAVLREAFRLLKPAGVLIGSDSLASVELHHFHEADTYNPIDPARLLVYLQASGFQRVCLSVDKGLIFSAHKCAEADDV